MSPKDKNIPESSLIVLKIFQNDLEANTARTFLDEAGIYSFISSDNYGGMMPALSHSEGIKLIVNSEDFEKSVDILKAMDLY